MRRSRLIAIAAIATLSAMAAPPPESRAQAPSRAPAVDVAVALAADVSRSIDEGEFELQRRGYAAAVTSPQFVQAVQSGVHGAVALCFLEWASDGEEAVVAKWMVIRDAGSAAAFARILLDAPRTFAGRTAIGDGIDFAVEQLNADGVTAARRVIDVSGDGTSNSGRPVIEARDDAVKKGITVNGLAIINEKTGGVRGTFLYAHTHPPGGLPNYYRDNVIGGPGAFVRHVVNFDTFAQAMTDKLVSEISEVASPAAPQRAASAAR